MDLIVELAAEKHTEAISTILKDRARWLKNKGIVQWGYLASGGEDEEISAAISNGDTYIASLNDEIVATFSLYRNPGEWDMYIWGEILEDDFIYLHRFAVAEGHHGKKIGSEILEWINNYCFDKRVNLRFDCVGSNIRLNQYYINHGFKLVETKHDHSKYEKRY